MINSLTLTGQQHAQLQAHLYPGDGKEAAALIICGRHQSDTSRRLLAQRVIPIPYEACTVREDDQLTWSTSLVEQHLPEIAERDWALVKAHSHPGGYDRFSAQDDRADTELFESVYNWTDSDAPHASTVMLPDGKLFGRMIEPDGTFRPLDVIKVVGDDLPFWFHLAGAELLSAAEQKNAQAFGPGTVGKLSRLKIAVVGCSGTGSPVIEMLVRLGVRHLLLVDPDKVEPKNLNRIVNTTHEDALRGEKKVDVLARALRAIRPDLQVTPLASELANPDVIRQLADCDVVFGCMDSVDGRYLLNRLAVYYLIPYFDVGVKLEADGLGGIDEIVGSVHYLQPDRSSLMSRGLFTPAQLKAANLRKWDPQEYERQVAEKYIKGAQVESPAIISVNFFYAALAVNEFLARLHRYRFDLDSEFALNQYSLAQACHFNEPEPKQACPALSGRAGRGDVLPLLDMPELS